MSIFDVISDLFDDLTGRQRFYVIAAILLTVFGLVFATRAISSRKINALEKDVAAARERADAFETKANKAEKEAAKYEEKIAYLESNLTEIQKLARTQDENIQRFESVVVGARTDAERAKRVRSIASTADELCKRLDELGHPCEDGDR